LCNLVNDDIIIDSGATDFASPIQAHFLDLKLSEYPMGNIRVANNQCLPIMGSGSVRLSLGKYHLDFPSGLLVPGLSSPLLSTKTLVKGTSHKVVFDDFTVTFMFYDDSLCQHIPINFGTCIGSVYYLLSNIIVNEYSNGASFHSTLYTQKIESFASGSRQLHQLWSCEIYHSIAFQWGEKMVGVRKVR
jgi:hypothetical protein